jgi:hypothetical protein
MKAQMEPVVMDAEQEVKGYGHLPDLLLMSPHTNL